LFACLQPKIQDDVRAFLSEAEEEAKERKTAKTKALWDDKIAATQTQSACGVGVV
jgi:hypothetical protein